MIKLPADDDSSSSYDFVSATDLIFGATNTVTATATDIDTSSCNPDNAFYQQLWIKRVVFIFSNGVGYVPGLLSIVFDWISPIVTIISMMITCFWLWNREGSLLLLFRTFYSIQASQVYYISNNVGYVPSSSAVVIKRGGLCYCAIDYKLEGVCRFISYWFMFNHMMVITIFNYPSTIMWIFYIIWTQKDSNNHLSFFLLQVVV